MRGSMVWGGVIARGVPSAPRARHRRTEDVD
eukprot:CAMPEP_0195096510 /NCGR_PEP_ID=MMETSP0448-20130528/51596_1 /TAXON_ID=66468 /ORGANISM="Heterocapsa triquestra, Strain CCMP 448" /LENGTH=30 /DNA_ID= /DNA_START= /DNA_END= /DNA_ORIENTATION=